MGGCDTTGFWWPDVKSVGPEIQGEVCPETEVSGISTGADIDGVLRVFLASVMTALFRFDVGGFPVC